MIETAKENGLKPFEYLKYIFETMPNITKENYHTLLPWSKDLPDSLRLGHNNDIAPAQ
ncbi:MAG: transposase domain-containing protein [Synergistaceae bacterium]|nr:transposase domain-containing protein [Synergistaceae bacterium]